jgi:Zn-dependent protease
MLKLMASEELSPEIAAKPEFAQPPTRVATSNANGLAGGVPSDAPSPPSASPAPSCRANAAAAAEGATPEAARPTANALTSPAAPSSPSTAASVAARPERRAAATDHWRFRLPAVLFLLTCVSTFVAGAVWSDPFATLSEPVSVVLAVIYNAGYGLGYMAAVMSILLAHEMGHFLQAVRYRVPASLPIFLPMPFTPLGTMGAVIRLRGLQANRKELFDIGLSGPIAGLLLALPLACIGIRTAEAAPFVQGDFYFGSPLIFNLLAAWLRPEVASASQLISHANPLVMASWVGMLVTGLNMLPIGQLDGGHVTYALLGKQSHWLARLMILTACIFIIYERQFGWSLMLAIVLFFGIHHPPTGDDRVELGLWRTILGWFSVAIPIFCLTPFPVMTI